MRMCAGLRLPRYGEKLTTLLPVAAFEVPYGWFANSYLQHERHPCSLERESQQLRNLEELADKRLNSNFEHIKS